MKNGRLFSVGRFVGCVLAAFLGLIAPRFAFAVGCGYQACESAYNTPHVCQECPNSPTHDICAYSTMTSAGGPEFRLLGSFGGCVCTAAGHPIVTPSSGFTSDPVGSCDGGCTVKCTGTCTGIGIGGKTWFFGSYGPSGGQCSSSSGPNPTPAPGPPCDPHVGICYDPTGPKFCTQPTPGHPQVCVPSPRPTHGPDCGTDAHSAICAGTPENPTAPPPPPPDPPIPPMPNGQPPPPDTGPTPITISCEGVCAPFTTGPVTIETSSNNDGGGDTPPGEPPHPGDDGGSGTGGDGQANSCPDGSAPVDGTCQAPWAPCPGTGAQPVNGHCQGDPGHCSDGSDPVNGVCAGDGHCSNGSAPVNGVCPLTCADGSVPVNGTCQAPYANCPDGSPPVAGRCEPSACNPQTDPDHCQNGTASGGGTCGAAPACNGDQIACATLFQTWSTRCAISGTEAPPDDGGASHTAGEVSSTEVFSTDVLDGSGFLGGGSCPSFGTVSLWHGVVWDLSAPELCPFYQTLGALFQLLCAVVSLRICLKG